MSLSDRPTEPEAPRIHVVEGISNLRDAGGYIGMNGARLRHGRLFRSAHPAGLDDQGLMQLTVLGIGTVVDLRGVAESAAKSMRDPSGLPLERVHVALEPSTPPIVRALIAEGRATPEALRNVMLGSYRRYVAERTPLFAKAAAVVIDRIDRGVMVHCAAGKDRTGFLIAMLLAALEVPRETIFLDYLATNTAWDGGGGDPPAGLSKEAHDGMRAASPTYLEAAFDEIDRLYGSFDDYLATGLGIDATRRRRLADAMLVVPG